MSDWRPSTTREMLESRAGMLRQIREFMDDRDILEVETPVLSRFANTDPSIQSLTTEIGSADINARQKYYLNTSPEFDMKRLLAADIRSIYQITKVFRDDEMGHLHQPEFSMLEWYRPGLNHHKLMDELAELIVHLGGKSGERITYGEVFREYAGLDPHNAETGVMADKARSMGLEGENHDKKLLLDFIFNHSVSPRLGIECPIFVYDYPACQAALAKLSTTTPQVTERFELFISGMEIANGFHELNDAREQQDRFLAENQQREKQGLPSVRIDKQLLAALEHGLPDCAGVAVGLDRLLMALNDIDNIDEVITFPHRLKE